MKKQTKIAAVQWCLQHLYQAEEKAVNYRGLPSCDGIEMDAFVAEIQRLTRPMEKRLLDLQREE